MAAGTSILRVVSVSRRHSTWDDWTQTRKAPPIITGALAISSSFSSGTILRESGPDSRVSVATGVGSLFSWAAVPPEKLPLLHAMSSVSDAAQTKVFTIVIL